ncbi:MAG: hypothetical protein CVV29_12645 [Methanobacteriales archaeon HGW-Methanobacteriales-2]|nr:MAG: hypothetical protein CVV29_12645 [Methanobacteriales archaeon HGW-Methanobacteriales-2]
MKLKLGIVLFLFVLIISSCNKEQLIEPNEEALCENMLYFDSYEEMNEELEKVIQMNQEARFEWEKSKGFTSIELEAERLYESIDQEKFKSIDEVKSFVEQHRNLIKLGVDDNGEYEMDTKHCDMPERYFLNESRMYQVGDSVYKVFDNIKIVAGTQDADFLKSIDEHILLDKNDKFKIVEKNEISNLV